MQVLIGVSAVVAALALSLGAGAALLRSLRAAEGAHTGLKYDERIRALNDQVADLRAGVAEMGTVVAGLPSLWETERERAEDAKDRAHKRLAAARAAESRARSLAGGEDDEDEDGDAEQAARLLNEHASGGNSEGLYALPEDVEGDAPDDLTRRALASGWSPYL